MTLDPEFLERLRGRPDILGLLRSRGIVEGDFFEHLADLLYTSAIAQKHCLERYAWRSINFSERSKAYLSWVRDSALATPLFAASFAEEIMNTVHLWSSVDDAGSRLLRLQTKAGSTVLGSSRGAHFSVQNYLRLDEPEVAISVQQQARFIETLQHERVHVFRRYHGLLVRDVPIATALGLVTAQEKLEAFSQPDYVDWIGAQQRFPVWGPFGRAAQDRDAFIDAVEALLESHGEQVETEASYEDGSVLAVAAADALGGLGEARLFLELLAYGLAPREAFEAARAGADVQLSEGRFVPGKATFRLRSAGLWTRGPGPLGICAREQIHRGGLSVIRDNLREAGIDYGIAHLVGLRSADQGEAQGFHTLSSPEEGFHYESLPHATYSSTPLVLSDEITVNELARKAHGPELRRYWECCAQLGVSPTDVSSAVSNPALQEALRRALRAMQAGESKLLAIQRICEGHCKSKRS